MEAENREHLVVWGVIRGGFRKVTHELSPEEWVDIFQGEDIPKRYEASREFYWNHNSNINGRSSDVFQEWWEAEGGQEVVKYFGA